MAQVSPKCSLLCGPSLEIAPTLKPKSPRNCHPPCGPSILDFEPNARPQAFRNGPDSAAQVSPNWSLLCGPSLPDMAPTLLLEFPRKRVFATWSKSPRNLLYCVAQVLTEGSLLHGPSLPEIKLHLSAKSPPFFLIVRRKASRNDPYCVPQISPKWPHCMAQVFAT